MLHNINNTYKGLINDKRFSNLSEAQKEALKRISILELDDPAPEGMKTIIVWYLIYTPIGDMLMYPLKLAASRADFQTAGQPDTIERFLQVFEAEGMLAGPGFSWSGDLFDTFGLGVVKIFDEETQTYTSQMTPEQIVELQKKLLLETMERDSVEDLIQDLYDNYLEPLKEMWTDDPRENHIAWESVHADFWY